MNTEEKKEVKRTAKKETPREVPREVELFKEFYSVDVSPFLKEKQTGKDSLMYLSWPKAIAIPSLQHTVSTKVIEYDADGIEVREGEHGYPYQALAGGTMGYFVVTEVTIDGITKRAFLPVMDSHQYPVKNTAYKVTTRYNSFYVPPMDALILNKNIMRCLTKNIALFGLGLYVYDGEDLPEDLLGTDEVVEPEKNQASKPEPAPKAAPKQTVKAAPKQETVAKAEPKPAPKPAPEPEPEDDEIEIIDATTGEVLDTPKVMGTEKKPMTLEEAKAYVPIQANPKVKGVPLGKLFESDVYTPKGALGVLNYYVKNSEVPGDKEAAGVLLAAMNIGDFLPEGVTLQKDETGKTVLVAEDVKKAASKPKGSKKKETATAEQA